MKVGIHDLYETDALYPVVKNVWHPDFEPETLENDIALMQYQVPNDEATGRGQAGTDYMLA